MMNKNKLSVILIAASLCVFSTLASANLRNGTVTNLSGSSNISSTNSGSVTIRWSMQSYGVTGLLPGAVISSTNGRFTDGGGRVIANNNIILSRAITPTIAVSTVNISETVRIPKSVLYTASKLGLTQLTYERQFTDCPGAACDTLATVSIVFNFSGGSAANFAVTSYKLRFDTGQVTAVVKRNHAIKAVGYINVTRTGTVRGVWEVATPVTTAGNPTYRIIRRVQSQLNSFSSNKIESPELPTDTTGIYLVRFRFLDPLLEGDVPTLHYNVAADGVKSIRKSKTLFPENGAEITSESTFQWQAMRDASAYKIEFIIPPADMNLKENLKDYTVVAGLIVKSDVAKSKLNKAVTQHLNPGRIYWWHIIGLNSSGIPVGESNWSSIKLSH